MADAPVKRQTAVKIRINDLNNSNYVKAEGDWQPNYLLTPHNTKISRINLLGTVIETDENSFTIDDGTGQIVARSFEELPVRPNTGDVVVVIGRPREFDGIYIVPEIVKIIQSKQKEWIELRKLELKKLYQSIEKTEQTEKISQPVENKISDEKEEKIEKENTEQEEHQKAQGLENKTFDIIMQTIKKMDDGDGADMENIITESGLSEEEVENVV
ncbi:MAG: hypothetical protein ACOCZQ_02420, partial [Nanoarchaeota archaeon]